MLKLFGLLDASATVSATASDAVTPAGGGFVALLIQILPLALVFVIFYFLLIRPQQKKEKETQKMRQSLEVGDEIVTIGGIIGRVVVLKEDNVVIETGSDRSKMRIARWAIQANNTVHDVTE